MINVVGIGPGSLDFLTKDAQEAIEKSETVLAPARLREDFTSLNKNIREVSVSETMEEIQKALSEKRDISVLATGDTGLNSIGTLIYRKFSKETEVKLFPGISSLAYICSRMGTSYGDIKLVSLHGVDRSIVPFVTYNEKVFALTGGKIKAHDVIKELCEYGLGHVEISVGENLSYDDERIIKGYAKELTEYTFDDLAVVVVYNKNYVNRYKTLRDKDFIRGKVPMSKEAVRNLSIATLEIKPDDVVYDIGAGTGSITCAAALKANEEFVYAIEKKEEAYNLIKENISHTGCRNIKLYSGDAPSGMEDWKAPDKVFIGGSTGKMEMIVDVCLSKNPKAVIAANAITLETLSQILSIFKEKKLDTAISCLNVAVAEKVGSYNMMMGENPVYIIKGVKGE